MIREQIKAQLIEAMKAKNEVKTGTLRLMNAAIKDKDIAARPSGNTAGIDDAGILSLLQTMIKQRRESIELYQKGNRPELADAEQAEIDIIQSFLPKQLTADETTRAVKAAIADTGAASVKDMGKVMAELKAKYAGRMDFSAVSAAIKGLLGG
ncbi:MAG: GatB/YqeY domain-containing protein [Alphaproteobacteria bacterium]|nr:GatB/YqeY domain-containing protein [Alphaproteobacteria bacterium]